MHTTDAQCQCASTNTPMCSTNTGTAKALPADCDIFHNWPQRLGRGCAPLATHPLPLRRSKRCSRADHCRGRLRGRGRLEEDAELVPPYKASVIPCKFLPGPRTGVRRAGGMLTARDTRKDWGQNACVGCVWGVAMCWAEGGRWAMPAPRGVRPACYRGAGAGQDDAPLASLAEKQKAAGPQWRHIKRSRGGPRLLVSGAALRF